MGLIDRLKRSINAFVNNRDPTIHYREIGGSYSYRPDRRRLTVRNERSIVNAIINRIAMDAASVDIRHVRLDENKRYLEEIDSGLNNCLSLEANIDQTGQAFIHDIVVSMLDEGCVAAAPIDTDVDPRNTDSYEIITMRTGKIINWYPMHVKASLYNDRTGQKEELLLHKSKTAIMENPFFSVMNESNSTMQRLVRKLNLLDAIDEQSGSGKLDLIIQLPYVIKTPTRKAQAEERRRDIEQQLSGSKYGIAYTDGTERITQLNRPVENNLMKQIEFLTNMLYGQLGITQGILDGTADEQTMLNYNTRTVQPIVATIVNEFKRKFLTRTARTQGQSIMYFKDPFKLVPPAQLAEIVDKFTRNEVMSSNEFRQILCLKPSDDPKADQLINSNISQPDSNQTEEPDISDEGGKSQNE